MGGLLLLALLLPPSTAQPAPTPRLASPAPERASISDALDAAGAKPRDAVAGAAAAAVRKAVAAVKGALADVGAGPGATRTVTDAAGLARALQDPDVRAVLLAGDVSLTSAAWGAGGPVLVTRRTLVGTDPPGAKRVLDFGRLMSAIIVSEGTRLVFQNVWLRGLAPRDGVAVDVSGFARLRPAGMSAWPSIVTLANATLVLDDTRVDYIADPDWGPGCARYQDAVAPQLAGLGYADASFEGPGGLDLVLPDFHGFDVPLQNLAEPGAPVVGTVAVRTDGVILSCVPPPPPSSAVPSPSGKPGAAPSPGSTTIITDASSGGRGSLGAAGSGVPGRRPRFHWWQGLAIGLAAGLILLLSLGVLVLSRRVRQLSGVGGGGLLPLFRRRRGGRGRGGEEEAAAGAAKLGADGGGGPRDDSAADVAVVAATPSPAKGGGGFGGAGGGSPSPPLPHSTSSAAALMLRARSAEEAGGPDIELGPLLGRGSYGKVFKGKWRGALVAVKVVDADVPGQRGGGGGDLSGGGGGGPAPGGGGSAASGGGAASASAAAAARESALAQAIVHPNVVATYKVLTVPVSHGRAVGGGGGGGGSTGGPGLSPTRVGGGPDDASAADAPPLPPPPPLVETWIVLEYCDRGSLEDAIAAGRFMKPDGGGDRDLASIYAALRDVAAGMEYLASLGVVHADLKPANILLKSTAADGEDSKMEGVMGDGARAQMTTHFSHFFLLHLSFKTSPRLQGPPLRFRPLQSPRRRGHPHVDAHLRDDRVHAAGADP